MAKQSGTQKRVMHDVMGEYKKGKLKSGESGRGGRVKSRRQAIAVGMHEAGASKYESKAKNRRNLRQTMAKKHKRAA